MMDPQQKLLKKSLESEIPLEKAFPVSFQPQQQKSAPEKTSTMEDDQNNLLPNPPADVVGQPARSSCSRRTIYTTLSILVALLIAGQALTVFFVYHHNERITKLAKDTAELKLGSLTQKLSQNSKPANRMKMSMVNMMPLVMRDDESLAYEAKLTNSTEDQVKRVLLRENPLRKFPELNNNFLENIGQLRKRMDYEDWKAFETWMHKWLLFQMAQNQIPEEKVKTKCQQEECTKGIHLGRFCAQCDENGNYLPKQCHHSTGFCWCVYKNGTEIEGTKGRGPLECTEKGKMLDLENVTSSGLELA
ncbi:HLA class II histocompatibility antigen gamma chain [Sceloporus undulatus]|uniref:HLA class II histocompatibility antigen gamma chain n=1 Tax=Sceloporus undulatus TaxID=8520 RepID=UPI001C4B6C6E|nr:HLA class II histocompatibility antigen gamma chain [Sceloporus undulatus]